MDNRKTVSVYIGRLPAGAQKPATHCKRSLHMTYYPEFSNRLNHGLQRQDRSASWLAYRLGVSPSTVARWLNHGTRPGTPEMVVQIADALGLASDRQALLVSAGYGYAQPTPNKSGQGAEQSTEPSATETRGRVPRLPLPSTPLVGRAAERTRLTAWIDDPAVRLVTILGPGGMGKTRLALAVAAEQQATGSFEHGVAFADLAPLSDVDQIPAAIAHAVGLPLESGSDPTRSSHQQVIDFLHSRRLLLLLDNAEHLLDAADLVEEILTAAPDVQILVTSRAPLRLMGEQLYPLSGLDYAVDVRDAEQTEAAAPALFMQCARRVRPDYEADGAEQKMIVEICGLVEGMPLAIELAASWVALMPAADILAAISQSLRFLETDLRGVPERHRSMEAVFDATWQRLSAPEQTIFAQLSLFRGGFTQEAVRHITGAKLGQLRTLAASSLIVYDHEGGRYTVHELLRQYGALRLADQPDLAQNANQAHSLYYFDLLRRRQNALKSRGLQTDLLVLDAESDNLGRAWNWATEQGQVDGIIATLDGLGLYLQFRGRSNEGEAAFRSAASALEAAGELRHLSRALTWQAQFARNLGLAEQASRLLERSIRLLSTPAAAGVDTRSERAFVLLQMGAEASARDVERARAFYEESLALFVDLEDQWYAAEVLLGLGHICLTQGDFDGQRAHVQQALDTYRTLGNVRGTASALSMLADIDSYRGRPMSGLELGFESLAAFRSLDDPMGVATCLSRIGMTYMNLGDVANARQVVSESLALFAEMGSRRDEVIAYAFLCAIELMSGDYWQAHAHAERSVAIATELDDQFVLGVAVGFLGWSQHYTGNLNGALKTLREAITITKQTGATMDSVRWHAQLGFAQWKNGQGRQARFHCHEALRLAVQVVDPWSLLTAISSSVAILADGDDPARAVDLYSMLMQDPLCANSRWFADGIGPHVTTAMAALPDDRVKEALCRGEGLDQPEEAVRLVDELSHLGWDMS